MSLRIAIVGSRNCGPAMQRIVEIRDVLRSYGQVVTVVSGGARGIDSLAELVAKQLGFPTRVYPADWNRLGKSAGFQRNEQIVLGCDELHAWWDGESKGTENTISLARVHQKKHFIHDLRKAGCGSECKNPAGSCW